MWRVETGELGEKPSDQGQNQQQLNPHMPPGQIRTQATLVGSKLSSHHCVIRALRTRVYNNKQSRQVANLPGRRMSRSFFVKLFFFSFLFVGGKRFWRWVSCGAGPYRWVECIQSKPHFRCAVESTSNPGYWMESFNLLSTLFVFVVVLFFCHIIFRFIPGLEGYWQFKNNIPGITSCIFAFFECRGSGKSQGRLRV